MARTFDGNFLLLDYINKYGLDGLLISRSGTGGWKIGSHARICSCPCMQHTPAKARFACCERYFPVVRKMQITRSVEEVVGMGMDGCKAVILYWDLQSVYHLVETINATYAT